MSFLSQNDLANLNEQNVEKNLFELRNVDLSNIKCKICGKQNLDFKPFCKNSSTNEHEIDENFLEKISEDIFETFIDDIIVSETEKKIVGVTNKTFEESEIIPNENIQEIKKNFRRNEKILNALELNFPHTSVAYLEKINQKETEFREMLKKYKPVMPDKFYAETEQAYKKRCQEYKDKKLEEKKQDPHEKFSDLFSKELFEDILYNGVKCLRNGKLFKRFLDNEFQKLLEPILADKNYLEYVKEFTNLNVSIDDCKNAYLLLLEEKINSGDLSTYFSLNIVLYLLKIEIIFYKLETMEAIRFFVNKLKEIKNSGETNYSDFIFYLKYIIKVKILKRLGMETYLPQFNRTFKTTYMKNYVSTHLKTHHFHYNFMCNSFVMNYKFTLVENKFVKYSKRNLFVNLSDGKTSKTVIDYLNFYIKIDETDPLIEQVIYKNGSDIRDKIYNRQKNIRKPTNNEDFFAIYYTNGSHVIFDLLSKNCYFTGTSKQIKEILKHLSSQYKIEFENPTFLSFKGSMTVTTAGILCKKIIQQVFLHDEMTKYWYTKSNQTSANNHSFVYWPDNIKTIPKQSDNSVSIKIIFDSKQDCIYNNWIVSFEGNDNSFIIPFFAMFTGFVHFMENIPLNKKYEAFDKASRELLNFYKKRSIENGQKWSDISTVLVAQNQIARRDIFNKAIKYSMDNPPSVIERITSRTKPIILTTERFKDEIIVEKWKKFYASIITASNPLFIEDISDVKKNNPEQIIEIMNLIEIESSGKGLLYQNSYFGMTVDNKKYILLNYPEKGKLSKFEMKDGFPTKTSAIIIGSNKISSQKIQNQSSRKKPVNANIQSAISRITKMVPNKSGFYFPKSRDYTSFRDFVHEAFPSKFDRITLLSQHMWDFTEEEIEETFDEINILLHYDLLQFYHKAFIFYFEFDKYKRQYVIKEPRHRYAFSYNVEYDQAMFIFKTQEQLDIVYFEGETNSIPFDSKMKEAIYTPSNCVTFTELFNNYLDKFSDKIEGQFFDTNGKSIGLRIKRESHLNDKKQIQIMDIRFLAQFPIFSSEKFINQHSFNRLHDTKTNVQEKFGNFLNDQRFTLIEQRSSSVRYNVRKIHEEHRKKKQDLAIFHRMCISLWFKYNKHLLLPDNYIYSFEDVEKYIEKFIKEEDLNRELVEKQEIENSVVIKPCSTYNSFIQYLEEVYPNRFYDSAFRVKKEDLEDVKNYMKREIDLIKNYSKNYEKYFISNRMDLSLISHSPNEIIGHERIFYNNMLHDSKKEKTSEKSYLYIGNFNPTYDINYDKLSRDTKAELVIITFRNKKFYIRMTKDGFFNTAVFLCDLWAKYKLIGPYECRDKKKIAYVRKFLWVENSSMIVESKNNEDDNIKTSGEDYWVLNYRLKNGNHASAAMLPINDI